MTHRPLTLSTALALALASSGASAMGLGQLQVKSGLNQPLVAEIPIISATASELDQLDVRLASPDAFSRVGLDRPGELTANLQFSVGKNTRGQPVIRVTTPTRFTEPLLSFLIEAEWGKGVVTREYTALIDPPYIAPAVVKPMTTLAMATAPAPVVVPTMAAPEPAPPEPVAMTPSVAQALPAAEPEAEPASVEALPEPTYVPPPPIAQAEPPAAPVAALPPPPAPVAALPPPPVAEAPRPIPPARPMPRPAPVAAAPTPQAPPPEPTPKPQAPAASDKVGPIAPGQTLWNIANGTRPDAGVSVNQMMIALLRANPSAFDQDNVNRLRSGSVLRVPGPDEVTQLSAAEAAMLVRQQANSWRNPRAAVPQPVEGPARQAAADDIAATAPSPAAPPRPPAVVKPAAAKPPAAKPAIAAAPANRGSRLEIVPPAGAAGARGMQSGAAAGAGGTELRAELVQAREDLAAKTSEVGELQSRLSDLEKQQADRQRLIDLQNSQLKQLQDRLRDMEAKQAAAAAIPAAAVAEAAPAAATPWYLNPFVLIGAVLVALGALVLGMRRGKAGPEAGSGRRLSDDEALRTSMARTRQAAEPIAVPAAAPADAAPVDSELQARLDALRERPRDLEAHLNLLRLFYARGNAVEYERAAQAMRGDVPSTLDPRWREAVVMGAALMPGHGLFGQAGWNSPRFEIEAKPAVAAADAGSAAIATSGSTIDPETVRVFDPPPNDYESALVKESPLIRDEPDASELNLDDHATVFGDVFGAPPADLHRVEAEVMAEDESSSTRIELAKAYLDIGDVDGARSMLEEVLIEGGPSAKAEAGRLLRDLP